jgi:hypothetical protein
MRNLERRTALELVAPAYGTASLASRSPYRGARSPFPGRTCPRGLAHRLYELPRDEAVALVNAKRRELGLPPFVLKPVTPRRVG